MGLFDFLKTKPVKAEFVTKFAFESNRNRQIEMSPQTIAQLRKLDISEDKELKLEFFFYTNTSEKAEELSNKLKKLNYTSSAGTSAGDKSLFLINGWTTKMTMSNEVVSDWVRQMCDTGYDSDCKFDGWGTDPGQE